MRIGIDLGGTKIELIALDPSGEVMVQRRVPTPRGDYRGTIECVAALVHDTERELDRHMTVGVGIPGTISTTTGLVKNANSVCLIGRPLADDLKRLLDRPARFANDANCFALSEAADGAAAGASLVFGVILGTGTGGGIVFDGKILVGANAIGGEWGHNPLPWPKDDERPGPTCYCGRSGCIETFLSGPGLARDVVAHGGPRLEAHEIVEGALAGAATLKSALERYEDRLARSLAHVINIIDPHVVVLGGGLSNIERLGTRVPHLWEPFVFSDHVQTRLVRATHGDSSGVRGAAWLWTRAEAEAHHGRRA